MKIQEYDAKYSPKVKKTPAVPIVASGFRADPGARSAEFQSQVEGHNQAARILEKYGRAYGTLAQGMADAKRFSDEIFGMAEKLKEARQAKKFNDGRTEMYQEIDGLLDKLPNEDEGRSRAFEFSKGAEKLRTDLINKHGLEDEFLTRFNQEFDNVAFKKWFADETDQITRAQLEYLEALPSWLAHFKEQYEAADRPETKAFFIQKAETLIRESAGRGIMNSKAADDMAAAFRRDIAETEINKAIQQNPSYVAGMEDEHFTSIGLAGKGAKYRRQAEDQVRINQAEAKRQSAARYDAINGRMEREIKTVLETGQGNDGLLNEVHQAEKAGFLGTGAAKEFGIRRDAARETFVILQETGDKPLQDRLAAVARLLPDNVDGSIGATDLLYRFDPNAPAKVMLPVNTEEGPIIRHTYPYEAYFEDSPELGLLVWNVMKNIKEDWNRLEADPVAYVRPMVVKRLSPNIAARNFTAGDQQEINRLMLDTSRELQERIGVTARVQSVSEAEAAKQEYAKADAEGRLNILQEAKKNYGDYTDQVLGEWDLDWKNQVAARLVLDKKKAHLGRTVMEVVDKRLADFDLGGVEPEKIKSEVKSALAQSEYGEFLEGRSATFRENPNFQDVLMSERSLLDNLVAHFVEIGSTPADASRQAVRMFTRDLKVVADNGLAYLVLPLGIDRLSVVNGLEAARERIAQESTKVMVERFAGLFGGDEPAVKLFEGLRLESENVLLEDIRQAVWVDHGTEVALVRPGTAEFVLDQKGRSYSYTLEQIEALGRGKFVQTDGQGWSENQASSAG